MKYLIKYYLCVKLWCVSERHVIMTKKAQNKNVRIKYHTHKETHKTCESLQHL